MADFKFNAGKVAGAHVGTVSSKDDLASKLEVLGVPDADAMKIMKAYDAAEMEYKKKNKGEDSAMTEKKGGAAKSLFDAVKGMA